MTLDVGCIMVSETNMCFMRSMRHLRRGSSWKFGRSHFENTKSDPSDVEAKRLRPFIQFSFFDRVLILAPLLNVTNYIRIEVVKPLASPFTLFRGSCLILRDEKDFNIGRRLVSNCKFLNRHLGWSKSWNRWRGLEQGRANQFGDLI